MVEFRCWLFGTLLRIFLVMFSVSRCWRWRNFGWRCDWDVRKLLFGLNFLSNPCHPKSQCKKAMFLSRRWTKHPVHIHSWKQTVAEFEIYFLAHSISKLYCLKQLSKVCFATSLVEAALLNCKTSHCFSFPQSVCFFVVGAEFVFSYGWNYFDDV